MADDGQHRRPVVGSHARAEGEGSGAAPNDEELLRRAEAGGGGAMPEERHVVIGRHRTLTQDCEFGIAQIVEIAIRALSPAANDTFTGVACVDWLADALLVLADNPPLVGNWYDEGGELRVWIPAVRIERLVKLAFDQIRQASATTPAVLIRQLDVIRRLSPRMPHVGFLEVPNVPKILDACAPLGLEVDRSRTSYYLGRETLIPTKSRGLWRWRGELFAVLSRMAQSASRWFGIPPSQVVELGMQVEI